MSQLGPMREDRRGFVPAPVIYQWTHADRSRWCVYQISRFRYDLYRELWPFGIFRGREFMGGYLTRYFAKRACRKGKA